MGREIVYCVSCGERITEDDFERRRAQTIEQQPYCGRCRPVTTPAAPPPSDETQRSAGRSTGTRRRNTTSRIPRVTLPPPSTPARNRTAWIVAAGLGALALIVVLVVATAGPKRAAPSEPARAAPPVPRKPREEARAAASDGLEDRVRELERFAAGSADPAAIFLRCDALRPAVKGTALEGRLKAVEGRALELRTLETDRASELDRCLASIRALLKDDAAFERRRRDVESLLETAQRIAGVRAPEVQKLREEFRARSEAAARPPEPPKAPARNWFECFTLAGAKIQANDYPAAKLLYLEGLPTLPSNPAAEPRYLGLYVAGLYNLACVYAVEARALAGDARKEAVDQAFKHLDASFRSGFARFPCPCHAQTLGLGHMADDKDFEAVRSDPRFDEIRRKHAR
jgi:hypothetical protein